MKTTILFLALTFPLLSYCQFEPSEVLPDGPEPLWHLIYADDDFTPIEGRPDANPYYRRTPNRAVEDSESIYYWEGTQNGKLMRDGGHFYKLDKSTGEVKWKTSRTIFTDLQHNEYWINTRTIQTDSTISYYGFRSTEPIDSITNSFWYWMLPCKLTLNKEDGSVAEYTFSDSTEEIFYSSSSFAPWYDSSENVFYRTQANGYIEDNEIVREFTFYQVDDQMNVLGLVDTIILRSEYNPNYNSGATLGRLNDSIMFQLNPGSLIGNNKYDKYTIELFGLDSDFNREPINEIDLSQLIISDINIRGPLLITTINSADFLFYQFYNNNGITDFYLRWLDRDLNLLLSAESLIPVARNLEYWFLVNSTNERLFFLTNYEDEFNSGFELLSIGIAEKVLTSHAIWTVPKALGIRISPQLSTILSNGDYLFPIDFETTYLGLPTNYNRLFLYDKSLLDPQVNTVEQPSISASLDIFPNPSRGIIHFGDESLVGARVLVTDIQGRPMHKLDHLDDTQLDLSHLPPGIYVVYAVKDQYIGSQKIILVE